MPLLLALLAIQAAEPLPRTILNPSFEQELRGWRTDTNVRGYRGYSQQEVSYSSDRAAHGRRWLGINWAARSGTPPNAYYRLTTRIDGRRHRGRTLIFSAAVRLPEHAHRAAALTTSVRSPDGASAREHRLDWAATWRREQVTFRVPRDAVSIELGFLVDGRSGALEADAVRLERAPR